MTSDAEHLSLFYLPFTFSLRACLVAQVVKHPKSMLLTTTLFNLPQRPHCSAITELEKLGFYFWALVFSSHTYFIAQLVKNLPAMRETCVWSLGWEDPLEKGKTTHPSVLAWRIPWIIYSPWSCKESDTAERLSLSIFFEVSVQISCPPLHLLLSFKNFKNLDISPFTDMSDVFSQYVSCLFI